jgi:hypothetical protein
VLHGEKVRNILKIFLLGSFLGESVFANINFASQNSRLSINGGTCVFGNAIDNWNGTLQVLSDSSISGNTIGFTRGNYTTSASSGVFTGTLDPAGSKKVLLSGSERFNADAGMILPSMFVGGTANILEGQPICLAPITLNTSAAELQLNVNNKLTSNIVMNGGSITLLNNLALGDDVLLSGSGQVNFNKKTLSMPGKQVRGQIKLFLMMLLILF